MFIDNLAAKALAPGTRLFSGFNFGWGRRMIFPARFQPTPLPAGAVRSACYLCRQAPHMNIEQYKAPTSCSKRIRRSPPDPLVAARATTFVQDDYASGETPETEERP